MSDLKTADFVIVLALGRWEVVRVFWKAMIFCMVLNWAALNDGVSRQQCGTRPRLPESSPTLP